MAGATGWSGVMYGSMMAVSPSRLRRCKLKVPGTCFWDIYMAKQIMTSDKLYPVYGPYSHAVRVGDMIFLHGTVGVDPQGRLPGDTPGRADIVGQCKQTIENMATALERLDGSLQGVVKVRAFLLHHYRPARSALIR